MDGKLMVHLKRADGVDLKHIIQKMLKPVLYEVSDLYPSWFPRSWVEQPLETFECGEISLHWRYHNCCRLVNNVHSMDASGVVCRFVSSMDDLCGCLMACRPCTRVYRLSLQVDQLRGVNVAFTHLLIQLDQLGDPRWLCNFAYEMGCWDATHCLAKNLQMCCMVGAERRFLDGLVRCFDEREREVHQMLLAVAMALHPRLGEGSALAVLNLDLLIACVPSYISPPLRSWSGVLGWVL